MGGASVRDQFPALASGEWAYLDAATTSLVPQSVLEAVQGAMAAGGGAHRSVHALGERATSAYEAARAEVAAFLGVDCSEVVFVRSATEGLNQLAAGLGATFEAGDEVIVSRAAHHSELLPWRRVCRERGLRLRTLELDERADLDLAHLERLIGKKTRAVAIPHVSNVTGAVSAVRAVAERLPSRVRLVVDGAQGVAHWPMPMADLRCDAYVFSGHKVYGPPGVGAVWAKASLWRAMQSRLVGGGMVLRVRPESEALAEGPARFEAGSPNVPGAVGLAAGLAFAQVHHDRERADALVTHGEALLIEAGARLLGTPRERAGVLSFVVDGVHAHDLGALAAERGVAIRVGRHCAEPLLDHFGVRSAARASFGVYSRPEDIEALASVVTEARRLFARRGA